jgi:hypothetical protein
MSSSLAVIGASDHYARAELVTLAARDGAPVLLDRRRVALIDERLPMAPYHHEALEMELSAAIELVNRVRRSVQEHADAAIAPLVEEHGAGALVLSASPFRRLPDALEEVLRSRALTNAADGMLYREALADAGARAGLEVHRLQRRSDPAVLAARELGVDRVDVTAMVAELGRLVGPPWQKDHKWATAAALIVLAPRLRS